MHSNFENMPRAYFEKRPMEQDYLEYSARDVEDLVEVQETM